MTPCHWDNDPTVEEELETGLIDLDKYRTRHPTPTRRSSSMTTYRDRLIAGIHDAPDAEQDKTTSQLKDALRALGEPVSGTKNELEKRLAEAQKNA